MKVGGSLNIQFKKGVLELCVLSLLSKRDFYGYELVEYISRFMNISEGTMYPLLRRFRKENYVETYLVESQEGPPRKYYSLSKKGFEVLEELEIEWETFTDSVNNILRGDLIE